MARYADVVLGHNPLIYWTMDDISQQPKIIHDHSGNARHFTFLSSAAPLWRLDGAFPGDFAIRLNGYPITYSTPDPILREGAPWTLTWYQRHTGSLGSAFYVAALAAQSALDGEFVRVEFHAQNTRAWVLATGAREILVDPGPGTFTNINPVARWHHLALRYDGAGVLSWFRDGIKIGEVAQAISLPSSGHFQLRWGAGWGTQSTTQILVNTTAQYSEIALFGSALSDEEIDWLAYAFEPRAHSLTADSIVTTVYAPLVSRGFWLGGERALSLGGVDDGEFRLWLGGQDSIELPMLGDVGSACVIRADGLIPLEVPAAGYVVLNPDVMVTGDALIRQDGARVGCTGYVVSVGGRSAPLPAVGRVRRRVPAGRTRPIIP